MNEQIGIPAVELEAPATVPARIECGCGFVVEGWDERNNAEVFAEHSCYFEGSSDEPGSWYASLFSLWGLLIVVAIGWAVVSIALGKVAW